MERQRAPGERANSILGLGNRLQSETLSYSEACAATNGGACVTNLRRSNLTSAAPFGYAQGKQHKSGKITVLAPSERVVGNRSLALGHGQEAVVARRELGDPNELAFRPPRLEPWGGLDEDPELPTPRLTAPRPEISP
jgi:hypothetical protein